MAAAKKAPTVVYGLKNVHYAIMTSAPNESAAYDKPKPFPGAVNLGLTPDGEIVEFYADDCVYYGTSENSGYTGDIEVAYVHDDFLIDVFGWEKADGMLYEAAGVEPKHIALLGEFATDAVAKRITLYNVLCGRPDINRKTREKSVAPVTQKMSLTARTAKVGEKFYVKGSTTPDMDETAYSKFFEQVKLPGAV